MKKLLAILCVFSLLLMFTACGNKTEQIQNESDSNQQIGTGQITEQETSGTSETVGEEPESEAMTNTNDSTDSDDQAESAGQTETSKEPSTHTGTNQLPETHRKLGQKFSLKPSLRLNLKPSLKRNPNHLLPRRSPIC